jgi:hypothetical protein
MIKTLASSILLTGCVLDVSVGNGGPSDSRTEVALTPVFRTASDGVDVLFVVDDSPLGALELQGALQQAFPTFLDGLALPSGLPDLHIGVVSTDLGTKGAEDATNGPGIGAGPGSCSGNGKSGNLLTNGSTLITGAFISDRDTGGGTRETNYTGTLADAFTAISSLGSAGCGFEQPLEAAKRALNNNPANVGFLRPNALLAVIVVTNEDDCSMAHSTLMSSDTATLGPLQSFRCTRFGVTCDDGGKTSSEMNVPGAKKKCHANATSQYLTGVDDSADFFQGLKLDRRDVMFGAITGAASALSVEMRVPPGGGTAIPALAAECTWTDSVAIDPAIRIVDHASRFRRHNVQMACSQDLTPAAFSIGRDIRGMVGDGCITRPIPTPVDCEVWDERADGSSTALPACSTQTSSCYRFVQDVSCGGGLRVQVDRALVPPADTMVSVRCRL